MKQLFFQVKDRFVMTECPIDMCENSSSQSAWKRRLKADSNHQNLKVIFSDPDYTFIKQWAKSNHLDITILSEAKKLVKKNFSDAKLSAMLKILKEVGVPKRLSVKEKVSTMELVPDFFATYLDDRTFELLEHGGNINSEKSENYFMNQISIARLFVELLSFSSQRMGPTQRQFCLSIEDLSEYVYVPFIVTNFIFGVPSRNDKFNIADLLKSNQLTWLGQVRDNDIQTMDEFSQHPFCYERALDLWDYFEEIKDNSTSQVIPYSRINMIGERQWNPKFIDALIAKKYGKNNGMAFMDFLILYFCVKNPENRYSLQYLFACFDILNQDRDRTTVDTLKSIIVWKIPVNFLGKPGVAVYLLEFLMFRPENEIKSVHD
ncbi:hypothetical protein O9G_000197 [Rozella allomycis CSF55]|uniref:Uncharacterized protein n=1 Tax=Rozella allomycis (strain CSF55) TaxID=988480 RepID=A0A075AT77_ROZAC|nr:hypothetical protein O9G_000197 [Rozella allomycis CSF55]|eukprot:EPZ31718.1 hypothetical protein O9G_000197 [Rozella allomycis CSF55]